MIWLKKHNMCLDLVVRISVQEKVINTDYFTNTNSENKPGFRVYTLSRDIKTWFLSSERWWAHTDQLDLWRQTCGFIIENKMSWSLLSWCTETRCSTYNQTTRERKDENNKQDEADEGRNVHYVHELHYMPKQRPCITRKWFCYSVFLSFLVETSKRF